MANPHRGVLAPKQLKMTQREREREKARDKTEKMVLAAAAAERLKAVVRRLPPNLPEEIFWQSVQEWVTEETVVWKVFYPGKSRKRLNKENIPSRAYIAFKQEDHIASFSRGYDGHLFRDKAGNESQAVVEFAPYQKIPTEKRKPDARNATIDADEDYISFLETLKASENAEPVTLESLIAASQPPAPPKTTPLLEALKAEKSASKDKEAILRNHAHYAPPLPPHAASKKDDGKKRGGPPAGGGGSAHKPTNDGPSGKKPGGKKQQPQQQQQKPLPIAAGAPGGSNNNNNKPGPGTPKAPRALRAPKPPSQPPFAVIVPPAANPNSNNSGTENPARRTRPVIGLASRQFEAALSGAGVATGTKSRREQAPTNASAAATTSNSSGAAQSPHETSPKRRRNKDPAAPAGEPKPNAMATPSILQRSEGGGPPGIFSRVIVPSGGGSGAGNDGNVGGDPFGGVGRGGSGKRGGRGGRGGGGGGRGMGGGTGGRGGG